MAASGAVSAWVQQNHTVAGTSLGPLMPITLAAYPSADGVLLTWTLAGPQRAEVYYQVQRSTVSPAYVWETIASPSDTYFTEITRETVQKWYRVRSLDYAGLASSYSAVATATYSTTAPTNEPQPDRPPSQSGPQPL